MFSQILVAIDRSSIGQFVFEEALALAKATGASLLLLNVVSPGDEEVAADLPIMVGYDPYWMGLNQTMATTYQEQWQRHIEEGLEMLRSLTDKATAAGVQAESRQNMGSPGRVICEVARSLKADLILVGRRGHSGLNELILGSVSNYVLHHAPCSVLTVQHPEQAAEAQTSSASA